MRFPSEAFRSVLSPLTPADSHWATSISWLCGRRQKGGHEGHRIVTEGAGPRPASLVSAHPASRPPLSSHSRCSRSRLVSPGPDTRPTGRERPLVVGLLPSPSSVFLSRDLVEPASRMPPWEPGRGSPAEEGGWGGGNTVLTGKERAQPWVNSSRPGLPGWPLPPAGGASPAPGTTRSDVRTHPPGAATCLRVLLHGGLS